MKKAEFIKSQDPCSFDAEWEDFIHANHIGTNANYNPYLDISRIFNCRAGKSNEEEIKDEREPMNGYGVGDSDDHLVLNNAPDYANEEEEQYKEGRCKLLNNPREILPTCKIKRFEVMKYSIGPTKEFVAIKECGHDDWMRTDEDACHAYQDIFTKIDERCPHPSMNHVHMFMKLHYWTLTVVVSQTSEFVTGASSLILSSSRLVPSCFAIFDLKPLSLSFDFVFTPEIFNSLSFRLDRLCRLAILCLDQHAHTLHLLESSLIISPESWLLRSYL
nr:hypothetical protein [Tanacetum cinerariifolium]